MMVSVLIPCYQEQAFIGPCLTSVRRFVLPPGTRLEVLVSDGMSTDGTRDVVAEVRRTDPRVRLLNNPDRHIPHALNRALDHAKGDYIVRLDAHSTYPPDYLVQLLETAQRTGADNIGGVCVTAVRGEGYEASVVQALTTHRFGVGDSGFRVGTREGPADTVPYGCFRRDVFERFGCFDERLLRAQDYELNRRIRHLGGLVWLNPRILVTYYQMPSLWAFLRRQAVLEAPYNAYLWWLAPYAFTPRHAVTAAFVLGLVTGVALAAVIPAIRPVYIGVLVVYLSLAVGAAVQQAIRYRRVRHVAVLPLCFLAYHALHGVGVLAGLVNVVVGRAPFQRVGRTEDRRA